MLERVWYSSDMKNPHAVALGRLGGKKGGLARASRLSAARRREISKHAAAARWDGRLPELVRPLFWSYKFEELSLPGSEDLVMLHVLTYGSTRQRNWLRRRFGSRGIAEWITRRQGKGLTVRQMLPWISPKIARQWQAANPGALIWENREGPASREKALVLGRVQGWRTASEQSRRLAVRQPILSPAVSLVQAMELRDLAGSALLGPDPVREREVDRVRAQWRRLRAFQP
jgi:hypothetical protein